MSDDAEFEHLDTHLALPADIPKLKGIVLSHVLGVGGMGVVYKGWHTRLCIPVAVKILSGHPELNGVDYLNEARMAAKVNHPNVARVYDVNIENGVTYIVQEFVEGESLADVISNLLIKNSWIDEARALEICADATRGLVAIHREGIVHLDIKPDNILIQKRDGLAKIVDLGLARRNEAHSGEAGKMSTVVGTPGFISPEHIQGLGTTPAADIYALGATLYELLTNVPAFAGSAKDILKIFEQQMRGELPDARRVRKDISAATARIITHCLQADPSGRPADAVALVENIADALARLRAGAEGSKTVPATLAAEPPARVVCVDDDAHIREFVEDTLLSAGHEVNSFPGGEPALKYLAEHTADVVLLDMEMPGSNGLKVLRGIRALPGCGTVPILFMSGVNDLNVIDTAIGLGAIDYLTKPVSPMDLLTRVECLSRLSRIQRERASLEESYRTLRPNHGPYKKAAP